MANERTFPSLYKLNSGLGPYRTKLNAPPNVVGNTVDDAVPFLKSVMFAYCLYTPASSPIIFVVIELVNMPNESS